MRGSVSIEYGIVLLVLVGIYVATLSFYLNQGLRIQYDTRRFLETKAELLKLRSVGLFVKAFPEANVDVVVEPPHETNIDTSSLLAEVNAYSEYNTVCRGNGKICTFQVGSPFTTGEEINRTAYVLVFNDGTKVGVRT